MGTASGINPKPPHRSSTKTTSITQTRHNTSPFTTAATWWPHHMAQTQPPVQVRAASIQHMRWSGEPPQRTNALGVPHRLVWTMIGVTAPLPSCTKNLPASPWPPAPEQIPPAQATLHAQVAGHQLSSNKKSKGKKKKSILKSSKPAAKKSKFCYNLDFSYFSIFDFQI